MDCVLCAVILGMHWAIGVHGLVFGCVGFVLPARNFGAFARGDVKADSDARSQESRLPSLALASGAHIRNPCLQTVPCGVV